MTSRLMLKAYIKFIVRRQTKKCNFCSTQIMINCCCFFSVKRIRWYKTLTTMECLCFTSFVWVITTRFTTNAVGYRDNQFITNFCSKTNLPWVNDFFKIDAKCCSTQWHLIHPSSNYLGLSLYLFIYKDIYTILISS